MILFDVRQPGILDRVMAAGHEILSRCIDAGGTITGEHGVGHGKAGGDAADLQSAKTWR